MDNVCVNVCPGLEREMDNDVGVFDDAFPVICIYYHHEMSLPHTLIIWQMVF